MRRIALAPALALLVLSLAGVPAASAAKRAVPPPGRGIRPAAVPDFDVRNGFRVAIQPTPLQLAAAERLQGATVRWNERFGIPRAVTRFGGHLTGPSGKPLPELAFAFLREHAALFGLSPLDLGNLEVARSFPTQVFLGQRETGRHVFGSSLTFSFDREGRLALVGGDVFPGAVAPPPLLGAEDAIEIAARSVGADLGAPKLRNPAPVRSELVTFPMPAGQPARAAWATTLEVDQSGWYLILVDAVTGELLYRRNMYADAGPQGTVFTSQNPDTTQQAVTFAGWVTDRVTSGNNTNTYADYDADNASDYQTQTPASGDPAYQHFDYTWTNSYESTGDGSLASVQADQDAAITQLFYFTNITHDFYYSLGFDEASSNFQSDNFGRGGTGGDPVLAEAFNGFGDGTQALCTDRAGNAVLCRNNANFGTPLDTSGRAVDGSSGRMQVFLGAPPFPYRFSEMEGDTIVHEYGHGLSNRLVAGGMLGGGVQTGGLGEGWGDWLAGSFFDDPVIFEYDSGNATSGLRSVAYDSSPHVYSTLCTINGGCEVHDDGEIWATVLWDLRDALIARYGFATGKNIAELLVVDGMKNTVTTPSFLDARDGILTSDTNNNGGANQCLIWGVFAAREMGFGATSAADQTTITTSTNTHSSCVAVAEAGGPYATVEGTDITLDASASTNATGFAWDLDNDGAFDDATGATPVFSNVGQDGVFTVGVQVTGDGGTATDTATVTVANATPTVSVGGASGEEGSPVTIGALVRDAGWRDPLSATISWGDGSVEPAAGTVENVRPDASLGISASHVYTDDGDYPVIVCGSDDDVTTCETTTVRIENVAPTVTISPAQLRTIVEGQTLDVLALYTDPGADDTHTATIDWGTGNTDAVPAAGGVVSGSHTYGDDGTFRVTVRVTDDDGGAGQASFDVTVGNLDPTAAIDTTGTTVVGGVPTLFAHAGQTLAFGSRSSDDGSDDLTLSWDFDDGSAASRTSLANPPAPDADPSPTVQPREVADAQTHAFADACLYDVSFSSGDDDAGAATDHLAVVITGNASQARSAGYWTAQFEAGQRNRNDFADGTLLCYLAIAGHYSAVFDEVRDASTLAEALAVLSSDGPTPSAKLDRQILAAWANFANGALDPGELVDTSGDGIADQTFLSAVMGAEEVRADPASTPLEVLAAKDALERVNR